MADRDSLRLELAGGADERVVSLTVIVPTCSQVAHLRGPAGAFGLSLMLAADLAIAEDGASVKLMGPSGGSSHHRRLVTMPGHLGLLQPFAGAACAQRLLLDGERLDRDQLVEEGIAVNPGAIPKELTAWAADAAASSDDDVVQPRVVPPGLRAYLVRRETLLRAPIHKAVEHGHAATAQVIQATYKDFEHEQRAPSSSDLQASLDVKKEGSVLRITIPHDIQDAKISDLMASFKKLAAASASEEVDVVSLRIQGSDTEDSSSQAHHGLHRHPRVQFPAEVSGKDAVEVCRWFSKWERIYDVMHGLPKCTVAHCSGALSQAQLEIAAMCDLRTAAPGMSAALRPELVIPATACIMLARQVGVLRARLLMLGLVKMDAETAASWGFVCSVSESGGLEVLSQVRARQASRLDTIRSNLDIAWNVVIDRRQSCRASPVVRALGIPGAPADGIVIDPSRPVMKDDKTKRPAFARVGSSPGSNDSDSDDNGCVSLDEWNEYLSGAHVVEDRRDSDHGMMRAGRGAMRTIAETNDKSEPSDGWKRPAKSQHASLICLPADGIIDDTWLEDALRSLAADDTARVTISGALNIRKEKASSGLWETFIRRLHTIEALTLEFDASSSSPAITPAGMQLACAFSNIKFNAGNSRVHSALIGLAVGGADSPVDILSLLPVQAVGYAKMMELLLLESASAPAQRLLPPHGYRLQAPTEKATTYVMSFPPPASAADLDAPEEPKRAPQSGIMGVGCVVPKHSYDQEEVASQWFGLSPADPVTRIFRASSIANRYFSVGPDEVQGWEKKDAGDLAKEHGRNATALGSEAVVAACEDAGIGPSSIAFLSVCTSTGLLLPGLTAHIANELGLDPCMSRVDIVGMGCSAGLNAMQAASRWVAAEKAQGEPGYAVALAVEVCSAAGTWNQSDGLNDSVVNSLFADGAAAVVVGLPHQSKHCQMLLHRSLCIPDTLKSLYYDWDSATSRFRFMLSPSIPYVMGTHSAGFVAATLERAGLGLNNISHWVIHGGGKKVILSMMHNLGLGDADVRHTDEVMRSNGNMSSPSFLFSFQRLVKSGNMKRGQYGVFMTMGPGAAVECCIFRA